MDAIERAGEIGKEVLEKVKRKVKEGDGILEVAEWVEEEIRSLGGEPAFPCSVAVNEWAAHCSPLHDDIGRIPEGSVVKVDLGVHVDGWICDCATTLVFDDRWREMYESVREALRKAYSILRPGVSLREIGAAIEKEITSQGFKPIRNLNGHSMDQYVVHAGISIPNYDNGSDLRLEKGMLIAIEPFATNGEGWVVDGGKPGIFSLTGKMGVRNPNARAMIQRIWRERKTLPFAERWVWKDFQSEFRMGSAIRDAVNSGALIEYPPLVERSGGIVAQSEATFIITEDGARLVGGDIDG